MSDRIYFPNLDGLRFVAASIVLVSHVEELRKLFKFDAVPSLGWLSLAQISLSGELAVTLFFVLSGYLITYLLMAERARTGSVAVKHFYMRRVLRIIPLYFTLVTLGLFVLPLFSSLDYPVWSEQLHTNFAVKAGLLYAMLPNVLAVITYPIPHISHIWSIGVEEQFYLMWPFLLHRFRSTLKVLVGICIAYLVIAKPIMYLSGSADAISGMDQLAQFLTLTRVDCMALGGLAAYLVFTKGKEWVAKFFSQPMRWGVLALNLALLIAIPTFGIWTHEIYAIFFCLLLLVLSIVPPKGFSLENSWFRYLGKISYGIYMWHFIAVRVAIMIVQYLEGLVPTLGDGASVSLLYVFSALLTLFLAAMSYRLLEMPFLKLKKRYAKVESYHKLETAS